MEFSLLRLYLYKLLFVATSYQLIARWQRHQHGSNSGWSRAIYGGRDIKMKKALFVCRVVVDGEVLQENSHQEETLAM